MSVKIILGDTSPITKKVFSLSLDSPDYVLMFAEDENSLKEAVEKENPQVVVLSSNITPRLNEFIEEILQKNPELHVLVLKSPFEKMELEKKGNIDILMKPVPSSKIKEYMESLKPSLSQREIKVEEEEGPLPEEEELSEEELQATTWESHTAEEAFSDDDVFPEEEEELSEEMEVFEEPMEEGLAHEELVLEEKEEIVEEVKEEPIKESLQEEWPSPEEEEKTEESPQKLEIEGEEVIAENPPEEKSLREEPQVSTEIPREVIEKIAWEVIPPLAEKILREEIQKLIKKLEES